MTAEITPEFIEAFCEKCAAAGLDENRATVLLQGYLAEQLGNSDAFVDGAMSIVKQADITDDLAAMGESVGASPMPTLVGGGIGGAAAGTLWGSLLGRRFAPAAAIAGALLGTTGANMGVNAWQRYGLDNLYLPSWQTGASNPVDELKRITSARQNLADQMNSVTRAAAGTGVGSAFSNFGSRQQLRSLQRADRELAAAEQRLTNTYNSQWRRFLGSSSGVQSRLADAQQYYGDRMAPMSDFLDKADDGSFTGWLRGRWAGMTGMEGRGTNYANAYQNLQRMNEQVADARNKPWNQNLAPKTTPAPAMRWETAKIPGT